MGNYSLLFCGVPFLANIDLGFQTSGRDIICDIGCRHNKNIYIYWQENLAKESNFLCMFLQLPADLFSPPV